jgi:hypothetical protein
VFVDQTLESHHAIAYAAFETINVNWADVNHPGILPLPVNLEARLHRFGLGLGYSIAWDKY